MEVDGNLQEEKRRIFEQFQLSSARSRKFALENNRRRKALEDRQKQWDLKEEQMRQNIIEQRKQQINNATQRFQRSHLPHPPPLRYKHCQRIVIPTVEEALIEIQSKVDSCNFQSSISTGNCGQRKSHTPSPNPIKPCQPSRHQALTAVEAMSQLLPVRRKTNINYQEIEQQRKQQDYSSQDSHPSDNCDSESLSSKDSLENVNPKYNAENVRRNSHLSPPFNSQKNRAGETSFTEIIVLGDNLLTSKKQYSYQQKKQEAIEEFNIKKTHDDNDNRNDNIFHGDSLRQIEWNKHHQKFPLESTVTINNSGKILNSKCKTEKPTLTTKHTILNNSKSDAPKYPQPPEGESKKLPVSAAIAPGKKVRFNKGVLNNQSEYGALDSNFGNFTFPKNFALMIRDSIELTKVKNKELWENNKVKLKGCWFDEEPMKENDRYNHAEDHILHHNRTSGLSRPDPNLTSPASTGCHSTDQADGGVQVRLHEERKQGVTGPLKGLGGDSKTPQRKGTVCVQPQSAAEMNQIARYQGKNIISHPAGGRRTSEERGMGLDCTPTDEQISQIWHSVRSALTPQHAKNGITTNAFDIVQVMRKPHLEQNRLPPDSGNRQFQRPLRTTVEVRLPPGTCNGIFPVKGDKVHKKKVYADMLEGGPGKMQKPLNLLNGLSTISMEEHKVLLSLDRLDQLLQCVKTHTDSHAEIDSPLTQDIKFTNHYGQHMS